MHRRKVTRVAGGTLIVVALLLAGPALAVTSDAPSSHHLIYLHGRIVQEQQSARPRNPQHGYYELDKIVDGFRKRGFVVSGGIRPKSATVSGSADRLVQQVRRLVASGVPADHVTVVGASMGAGIALLASARLQDPNVRFALLGACLSGSVRDLVASEGKGPGGRLLSIREASDESTEPCPPSKNDRDREIVLHTGLGHGFLYQPLPEWVDPVVAWAEGAAGPDAAAAEVVLEGGHAAQVEGVAFSRDGRWLASADNGGRVVLWDVSTRRPLRSFEGRNFTEVAFTPDAKLPVAAGDDGRRLVSGCRDGTIKIWDAATGDLLRTLTGHLKKVSDVAFSPDGRWLASASSDLTVRLWRIERTATIQPGQSAITPVRGHPG